MLAALQSENAALRQQQPTFWDQRPAVAVTDSSEESVSPPSSPFSHFELSDLSDHSSKASPLSDSTLSTATLSTASQSLTMTPLLLEEAAPPIAETAQSPSFDHSLVTFESAELSYSQQPKVTDESILVLQQLFLAMVMAVISKLPNLFAETTRPLDSFFTQVDFQKLKALQARSQNLTRLEGFQAPTAATTHSKGDSTSTAGFPPSKIASTSCVAPQPTLPFSRMHSLAEHSLFARTACGT